MAMWLLGFPISFLSDYALRNGKSTTLVRKICSIIGYWIPALCMLILSIITTTNKTVIVGILIVAIGFNCGTTCSTQLNYIDLAPNYVAPMASFGNTLKNLTSLGMPYFFKFVITDPVSIRSLKKLFFNKYFFIKIINKISQTNTKQWQIFFFV